MSEPATERCPDIAAMEAALRDAEARRAVEAHAARCGRCARRLGSIRRNNDLVEELSATGGPSASAAEGGPPDIPGYHAVGLLHAGSQGVVFRGVQRATGRQVAIKILRAGTLATTRQRRRFEREIELVASLRHPNIVAVYDSGATPAGGHFFAMELVEGVALDRYLQDAALGPRGSRARTRALLELFVKVCAGVAYAHQHGVIHRDLKPGNIMVDRDGEPRVLDFGLARAVAEDEGGRVTRAGEFLGTLAYAAPEQASGDPSRTDVRTDVYALGAILYEMLTGRLPRDVEGPLDQVLQRIAESVPARPLALARRQGLPARIDGELQTIVLKALATEKERRYESAGALGADVERYLAGLAIDARRDSAWYVLRKAVARHRWRAGAATAFLVLLAVSAVVSGVLYGRAVAEADKLRQINTFWEDTLASAEPRRAGEAVTVADLLDEARPWASIAFPQRPDLEATVRITLGNSYRALGRLDAAERELAEALRIREGLYGEHDPDVAAAVNALGLVARERGDLGQAEKLMRRALDIRRGALGDDHLVVAMSWQNVGVVLARQGEFARAEEALSAALRIRAGALGDRHPDTAMIRFQIAELCRTDGRLDDAVRLHGIALSARRDRLPPGHPDLPRSLLALGRVLVEASRFAEAEPLLRECERLRAAAYGPDDWRTGEAATELGACLRAAGRLEEAEPLLLGAVHVLSEALGARDARTRNAIRELVALYEERDDLILADQYRARLIEGDG